MVNTNRDDLSDGLHDESKMMSTRGDRMFNKTLRKVMALFAVILSVTAGGAIFTASAQEMSEDVKVMHFDIAEDATRFVFDENPVF